MVGMQNIKVGILEWNIGVDQIPCVFAVLRKSAFDLSAAEKQIRNLIALRCG